MDVSHDRRDRRSINGKQKGKEKRAKKAQDVGGEDTRRSERERERERSMERERRAREEECTVGKRGRGKVDTDKEIE